jgi:hypothetical protein
MDWFTELITDLLFFDSTYDVSERLFQEYGAQLFDGFDSLRLAGYDLLQQAYHAVADPLSEWIDQLSTLYTLGNRAWTSQPDANPTTASSGTTDPAPPPTAPPTGPQYGDGPDFKWRSRLDREENIINPNWSGNSTAGTFIPPNFPGPNNPNVSGLIAPNIYVGRIWENQGQNKTHRRRKKRARRQA